MTPSPEITVTLTVDEINVTLQALGRMPFEQVYRIIHKIHTQAQEQGANYEGPGGNEPTKPA
jgi:hypothetical protein